MTEPHSIAEYRSSGFASRILVRSKDPAQSRCLAKHGQQIGGDANGAHALGLSPAGQVVVSSDGDCDLFKAAMSSLDVKILRGGKPILGDIQTWRPIP